MKRIDDNCVKLLLVWHDRAPRISRLGDARGKAVFGLTTGRRLRDLMPTHVHDRPTLVRMYVTRPQAPCLHMSRRPGYRSAFLAYALDEHGTRMWGGHEVSLCSEGREYAIREFANASELFATFEVL